MLEIRDLFMLLSTAFNQPRYRVDKQLNVLPEEDVLEQRNINL